MAEVKNDRWIINHDGVHYFRRISTVGYWIVRCLAPCFVCQCHQHGVPYEKIFEVVNGIYLNHELVYASDMHSHTSATIENWEKEITKNIKGWKN